MKLTEVTDAATEKVFLEVNAMMNKNNPAYIRPLDAEINEVFDKNKNKSFRYGEAKRWILLSDDNKPIGRIAAFTNSKYINKGTEYPVGGVGFFDCIDNLEAAAFLFDAAKQWLQQKGVEAMDGPINFGDRDKWWGLLIEGNEKPPIYGLAYNPPYYQKLMEDYGFKNYYNQYYFAMGVDDPLPAKFPERYAKFKAKKDYSARHISIKNLDKHAQDFATVYNAAWAQHGEAKEITKEQVMKLFMKMKPIMDVRLIWFAYYKEEPIAMWINIPDLNEYFKHFDGKFGWKEKLRLLWMKWRGECKIFTGVAFGIVPKYQSLGVDSFMIQEGANLIQYKGWYHTYEMGWAGDWNPKMINIYKSLGAHQSRRLITYRFVFDEQKHPFERHPVMEYK